MQVSLINCRSIYEQLLTISYSLKHKTLIQARLDEIFTFLRYVNYQLGGGDLNELVDIKNSFRDSFKIDIGATSDIEWRGESIHFEKDLSEMILSINNFKSHLEDCKSVEDRLEMYDKVIGIYWEASSLMESANKENKEATKDKKSSQSDQHTKMLQLGFDYIVFGRVMTTLERNLYLIQTNETDQSRKVKKHDNIKLCFANVKLLKEFNQIDSGHELQGIIQGFSNYIQASLKYHFASFYQSDSKFGEALEMVKRSRESLSECRKILMSLKLKTNDDIQTQEKIFSNVEELESTLLGVEAFSIAELYLHGNVDTVTQEIDDLKLEDVFMV